MGKMTTEKECRIAVCSSDGSLQGKVASMAKCTHFVIFKGSPADYEVAECKVEGPVHERGPNVARLATSLKVGTIITGTIGPKAFKILREAGITVKAGCRGTVVEAIGECAAGLLKDCKGATYAGMIEL